MTNNNEEILPSVELMLVTPDMAKFWLSNDTDFQRKIREKTVNHYANLMRKGQWDLNHQSIAITSDGKILDGQHRLLAVYRSKQAVRMFVTLNADPATFASIDRGYGRTVGQIVSMSEAGWASTCMIAAVNTLLWEVGKPGTTNRRWSEQDIVSVLSYFRKDLEIVFKNAKKSREKVGGGYVRGAFLRVLLSTGQTQEISKFIDVFSNGIMREDLSPACNNSALGLRNKIQKASSTKGNDFRIYAYGCALSSVSHFLKGTCVKERSLNPPAKQIFPCFVDKMLSYESFNLFIRRIKRNDVA